MGTVRPRSFSEKDPAAVVRLWHWGPEAQAPRGAWSDKHSKRRSLQELAAAPKHRAWASKCRSPRKVVHMVSPCHLWGRCKPRSEASEPTSPPATGLVPAVAALSPGRWEEGAWAPHQGSAPAPLPAPFLILRPRGALEMLVPHSWCIWEVHGDLTPVLPPVGVRRSGRQVVPSLPCVAWTGVSGQTPRSGLRAGPGENSCLVQQCGTTETEWARGLSLADSRTQHLGSDQEGCHPGSGSPAAGQGQGQAP